MTNTSVTFAAIGLDHRHIFGMAQEMMQAGATFKSFWTIGEPSPYVGFKKRFPDVPRVQELNQILEDKSINLVLIAAPPEERAKLSIAAMEHGKDVMLDKPGCITLEELDAIRAKVSETQRIWSVNFSERFEVPAVACASELVFAGRIGEVVQTIGIGPHRLNEPTRPDWFFDPARYGGILGDIGMHQIDQFMHFTGATDAEIVHAAVGNFNNPQHPVFQDFGEMNLTSGCTQAYLRMDWYTPDALPNWGDGRLFVLGTEGYVELRKYVDVNGRSGTDHVMLVNGETCEYIDAAGYPLPYFGNLLRDVVNRTETACGQEHTFKVTELALQAQEMATSRGNLIES